MTHYEVIVIGVGCMGSAACASLARRGVRVLGLEQHTIPTDLGSSGHQSRIFRLAYYEHPDYVPLLKQAYSGWQQLQIEADMPVFAETGGLYIGQAGGEFVEHSQASAIRHGLQYERLDKHEIESRYPVLELPDDFVGLYEQPAGMIFPERAIQAQADLARRHGAHLLEGVRVHSWEQTPSQCHVETDSGRFTSDRLVICSGGWTPELCPGIPLSVSRQILGWMQTPEPDLVSMEHFTTWAIELEDQSLLYGFPLCDGLDGPAGFKMARHLPGASCDPRTLVREAQPGDEDDFLSYARRFLPRAVGPVTDMKVCLYTNTPDKHFIIDRHPRHDRVFLATGFSGHGFKFQPIIGEILADLAVHGSTDQPIGFLGLDRFERS